MRIPYQFWLNGRREGTRAVQFEDHFFSVSTKVSCVGLLFCLTHGTTCAWGRRPSPRETGALPRASIGVVEDVARAGENPRSGMKCLDLGTHRLIYFVGFADRMERPSSMLKNLVCFVRWCRMSAGSRSGCKFPSPLTLPILYSQPSRFPW